MSNINTDSLFALADEITFLRARVEELERERDEVTACLAGREKHLGERIQTLIESGDLSARAVDFYADRADFHADRAAEMERDLAEARLRVCTTAIGCGECERCRAVADAARLREALEGLLREEWMTYEGNLDATGHASVDDLEFARAALASTTSAPPPREAYMRVAVAVREACLGIADFGTGGREGVMQSIRDLDLAAVVAKALGVGT